MSKLPRKTAYIFAESAGAVPGGIGIFGSLAAGTPAESTDLDVIQTGAGWPLGWGQALVNFFPAQEDLNSIPFVLSQQIAYLLQQGLPEYDSTTTYFTNSFCSFGGVIYYSLTDNNLGNSPSTSSANWAAYPVSFYGGTAGGSSTALTLTIPNFPLNAVIPEGTMLSFIPSTKSISSATTLNINGNGALALKVGGGNQMQMGQMQTGTPVTVIFKSVAAGWLLINPIQNDASTQGGSSFSTDQNDFDPFPTAQATYNFLLNNTSGGNVNITGIVPHLPGQIINVVSLEGQITIKSESGSSTAANRFNLVSDVVIPAPTGAEYNCAQFLYLQGSISRWILLSKNF